MRIVKALPLLLLLSCVLNTNEKVDLTDFDYSTTDDAELFFKNIRQSEYDLEEMKEAQMNIFTLKGRKQEAPIWPTIIHNWSLDQATIWLQVDSSLQRPIEILIKTGGAEENLFFEGESRQEHLIVANKLFEATLDSAQVFVNGQEVMDITSSYRSDYRIVMNDYYRLVGLK